MIFSVILGMLSSHPISSSVAERETGRGFCSPKEVTEGGETIPPERRILKASSIDKDKLITSRSGTTAYHPEVGLGVVGMKTLSMVSLNWVSISPPTVPVTNAIAQTFLRGYSTKITRRNLFLESCRERFREFA